MNDELEQLPDPNAGKTRIETPHGWGWTADGVEVTLDNGSVISVAVPSPSIDDYKKIIDEYIEGVAKAQEYDNATSFRSRAGYVTAFQPSAIAYGQWSDAIYVWSSHQRENPPATAPTLAEFKAMLVSEFPIPDAAVMAANKANVLAWFNSWFS